MFESYKAQTQNLIEEMQKEAKDLKKKLQGTQVTNEDQIVEIQNLESEMQQKENQYRAKG